MKEIKGRTSLCLPGYDYASAGLYFITMCVNKNICLFGEINDGKYTLYESGKMIEKYCLELENKFKNIVLHKYVFMPSHFHGIIEIKQSTHNCDCKICRGTPLRNMPIQ